MQYDVAPLAASPCGCDLRRLRLRTGSGWLRRSGRQVRRAAFHGLGTGRRNHQGLVAGRKAVQALVRRAEGKEQLPFTYRDKGSMAVIGRRKAVVDIGKWSFGGTLAWLLWMLVHVAQLVGFRNRAVVLFNWGWKYLSWRNTIRLIVRPYVRKGTAVARPFVAVE